MPIGAAAGGEITTDVAVAPRPVAVRRARRRRIVGGALLAALLSAVALALVTEIWDQPLHVPFQYALHAGDDEQDATLDLMLVKNIDEQGWFDTNPRLNAPFAQHWAEWPMGGDLLAYTIKKGLVDATHDVPLTLNLFWLLTFPLAALAAYPVLRCLRCSAGAGTAGAVLFALAPYHFRNGTGHSNLAFAIGIPVIVLAAVRMLGPAEALPALGSLRTRDGWRRLAWLLAGAGLVGVTGIYYLAFLVTVVGVCAVIGAIVRRRVEVLVLGALIGAAGLAASIVANLPTLLFRWSHPANILSIPDRRPAVSEAYPLRLVELLSPVTRHRLRPFAWISTQLSAPGRTGLSAANLGLAASIGLVVALGVLILRALRVRNRGSWRLEARLGVVMLVCCLLGVGGGLGRALELAGLQGIRAWSRITIVIAFAAIVVFARLLDRARVVLARRRRVSRPVWLGAFALIVAVGVLDQTSGALLPNPGAHARLWRADGRFVATLERALPRDAMVFQLPVQDFPEHGAVRRMSDHDLIKEGYLHSRTLRWSAGGIRGRAGEWQWPAVRLKLRVLVRGLAAMGFAGLTLDRRGYVNDAQHQLDALEHLLGPPIVRADDRLVGWDLRRAAPRLLAGTTTRSRARLARRMLDAPRTYLSTDADPVTDRGAEHRLCRRADLQLVNPGRRRVDAQLAVDLTRDRSDLAGATLHIGRRTEPLAVDLETVVTVTLRPGTTRTQVDARIPGVRCDDVEHGDLPSLAVHFTPSRR